MRPWSHETGGGPVLYGDVFLNGQARYGPSMSQYVAMVMATAGWSELSRGGSYYGASIVGSERRASQFSSAWAWNVSDELAEVKGDARWVRSLVLEEAFLVRAGGQRLRRAEAADATTRAGRVEAGAANRPPPEIACALATCLFGHAMLWAPPPSFCMFSRSSLRCNLTSSFSWTPSVEPCNRLLYIITSHTSWSGPVIPPPIRHGHTRRKLLRI